MSSIETAPNIRHLIKQRIEQGSLELPVLPEAAAQVVGLSQDETCDLPKLANVIKRDQALAGNVLRISNSPVYSGGAQIKTLDHALGRLGMKKVRDIALIISCESRVFQVKGYEKEVRLLFRHSLAAAAYAEEIARLRRWNVEEAFLCGLLHDVGRPVLLQAVADFEKNLQITFSRDEVGLVLNELHADIGGELVKSWSLPERLSETIKFHHNPLQAPTASQTATLTNMANDLSHFAVGPNLIEESALREHAMLAPLNIYPEEMDALISKREKIIALVEAVA